MDQNTKNLLASRQTWAALIGLAVVLLTAYIPGYQLDVEHAVGLVAIIVGYVVGVAVDPGPFAGTWRGVTASRRFWSALGGFVILLLDSFHWIPNLHLDIEHIAELLAIVLAYMTGVTFDPGEKQGSWLGVIRSRKFWTAAVGLVWVFLDAFRVTPPITMDQTVTILLLICGLIGGFAAGGVTQGGPQAGSTGESQSEPPLESGEATKPAEPEPGASAWDPLNDPPQDTAPQSPGQAPTAE